MAPLAAVGLVAAAPVPDPAVLATGPDILAKADAMGRAMKVGQGFAWQPLVHADGWVAGLEYWKTPGKPALHPSDAEYTTVIAGAGTMISGGTLVDPVPRNAGLVEGSRIEGGTERPLKPGDVILVPAGVPHWFGVTGDRLVLLGVKLPATGSTAVPGKAPLSTADYAADARALPQLVRDNYAYLDELPGGALPQSAALDAERDAVHDADSLLRYAEDVIATLTDHHALTARSFSDDWAIVPSYSDLWITASAAGYVVDAVKENSPAATAGVRAGDRLTMVDGQPVAAAVAAFWTRLGLDPVGERRDYVARVLAAGRRDRPRRLTLVSPGGERTLTLPSLYAAQRDQPPVSLSRAGTTTTIRFNNSIGDDATVAAFDAAMAAVPRGSRLVLDLTDTPSGGTTSVARGIMSWFVSRPAAYQRHQLPAEERQTGVARQWVEYVLPRSGKHFAGSTLVRVGRWTGSMGEGLAVGFAALGVPVCGTRMAGLKGAVYDFDLPRSGLRIKFPAERLYTVGGLPRQRFVPRRCPAA